MKRIIALLVVMLAFGLNANAQQKKASATTTNQVKATNEVSYSDAANKDITMLSEYVKLTSDQKVNLKSLFEYKHRMKADNLSAERNAIISQSIESKLKSTLQPDQVAKIEGNTQLMNMLVKL